MTKNRRFTALLVSPINATYSSSSAAEAAVAEAAASNKSKLCLLGFITAVLVAYMCFHIWSLGSGNDLFTPVVHVGQQPSSRRHRQHDSVRESTRSHHVHYLLRYNWTKIRSENEDRCIFKSPDDKITKFRLKECVILFFHIHKTAGTTICHAANQHKLKTLARSNCNLPVDQTNSKEGGEGNNYEQYMVDNTLQFGALEYGPFRPNPSANRTLYMISIRHPVARLLSDYSHSFCRSKPLLNTYPCLKQLVGSRLQQLMADNCFQKHVGRPNDNYYIKQLAGGCANDTCTNFDLEAAKAALLLMSVVIVTDTTNSYTR